MSEPAGLPPEAKLSLLRRLVDRHTPLLGFGMASLVTGLIGLLLFFLPVLGIPVSVLGLALGVIAVFGALFGGGPSLRWGLGGSAVCCLALGVNLALDQAPRGYGDVYPVPPPWQLPRDRPYVPPPASGAGGRGGSEQRDKEINYGSARARGPGAATWVWQREGIFHAARVSRFGGGSGVRGGEHWHGGGQEGNRHG